MTVVCESELYFFPKKNIFFVISIGYLRDFCSQLVYKELFFTTFQLSYIILPTNCLKHSFDN